MDIFANHAHVFKKEQRSDGTISVLRNIMDECGIGRCVCFAPFYEFGLDYNPNTWLSDEINKIGCLEGFGVVDIHGGSSAKQVEEIAGLGFKGIKMHPAFQRFKVDSPEAFEVYKKAEELGLFISFHTGIHWHRIKDYQMLLFDEVAYYFPALRFSLEHVGGYCFFNEALGVILNNFKSNRITVYAGLTSVFDNEGQKFWYLDDKKINDLLHLAGDDYCIFGLDFPYNDGKKIKKAIDHVMSLPIGESSKEKILGGNLDKVLSLKKGK